MTLRLNGATSGYVELDAPAVAGTTSITLPATSGTLLLEGGGKILQIVRATDSTSRETTSTSYVDVTGMSVTITPQRSNSAILILATGPYNVFFTSSGASNYGYLSITDSSNNALSGAEAMEIGLANLSGTSTMQLFTSYSIIGRSTPATTSAVTYKLRFRSEGAATTVRLRNNATTGQMYAIEVSA
jgi:hypothetical protein